MESHHLYDMSQCLNEKQTLLHRDIDTEIHISLYCPLVLFRQRIPANTPVIFQ